MVLSIRILVFYTRFFMFNWLIMLQSPIIIYRRYTCSALVC